MANVISTSGLKGVAMASCHCLSCEVHFYSSERHHVVQGRSSPHARQRTMWPARAPRATGPVTERGADNGCSRRNLGNVMLSERRWSQKATWHTSPPLNVHRRDTPGDGEPSGGARPGRRAGEVTGWGLCVS